MKKHIKHYKKKKSLGVCQYGGCWRRVSKSYCGFHMKLKQGQQTAQYRAGKQAEYVIRKKRRGFCIQGGCWVPCSKTLCKKHMDESVARKRIWRARRNAESGTPHYVIKRGVSTIHA